MHRRVRENISIPISIIYINFYNRMIEGISQIMKNIGHGA